MPSHVGDGADDVVGCEMSLPNQLQAGSQTLRSAKPDPSFAHHDQVVTTDRSLLMHLVWTSIT
jgi:hypothetical protein